MNSDELNTTKPQRKLSIWRLFLAFLIIAGITASSLFSFQWVKETRSAASYKSWFASYVDVTATPTYGFEQLGETPTKNVVLSFIVSSKDDPCAPYWGALYSADEARSRFDLDRRIARLRQQGGNIAISFGGLLNDELALNCTDDDRLYNAYKSIVDRYNVDTLDFDLEGSGLVNLQAAQRRARALSRLQKTRRASGKSLAIWLTVPVAPQGMTLDGTNAVAYMLAEKVDLAGINVMIMDYGQSRSKNLTMAKANEQAILETYRQLGIIYKQAGINLNSLSLWKKIGATPMIGQNDSKKDIFTLDDANMLNKFALSRGIGRISIWSANRDVACGENYVDTTIVSDSCSGVKQNKLEFSTTLAQRFDGKLKDNAKVVTTQDPAAKVQSPDDPSKSPYQIWKETGAYLQGSKVVWHHNVYEAKWWTQGEIPDNPVLQSWQTAWQLVGPVLPGEKPIKQPTLPAGTYPNWSGEEEYEAGDRVLFNGVAYQAKWWNNGESPAAASSNADSSPWAPLTQEEVRKIMGQPAKKKSII